MLVGFQNIQITTVTIIFLRLHEVFQKILEIVEGRWETNLAKV